MQPCRKALAKSFLFQSRFTQASPHPPPHTGPDFSPHAAVPTLAGQASGQRPFTLAPPIPSSSLLLLLR